MTWMWEKLRTSLRNGSFKVLRLQRVSNETCCSSQYMDEADDDTDIVLGHKESLRAECEEEEALSIFNVCESCKLNIHQNSYSSSISSCSDTSVNLSSSRNSTCPFCGIRYRELSERQQFAFELAESSERNEPSTSSSTLSDPFRQQRSCSDPTVSTYRLPPIHDPQIERISAEDNTLYGRLFRSQSSRMSILLPPIRKDTTYASSAIERNRISQCEKRFSSNEDGEVGSANPVRICYPVRYKSREEFLRNVRKAHQNDNYSSLQMFYMRTFESFHELCSLFKVDAEEDKLDDPGLKMEFIYSVFDALDEMPSVISKTVLKAIINALLEVPKTLFETDEARVMFVLLQCPIFSSQSSYIVYAHLLRYCINMTSHNHQLLVGWFKLLEVERLRSIIRRIMQFITVRQFPTGDKTLPPLSKSRWWIPTATKLLALLNAANNEAVPAMLHYTEFYNSALDHIDLMRDYFIWQNCSHPGQFAYCQYPFILSILAKRIILTKDSEQQMILNARRSLVAKMERRQAPQIDIFFLNINVRRGDIVSDSLNEITCKQTDLKKKLKVSFVGEPGLDMGGLTKEWFSLLIKEIFDSDYGMFVYHYHSKCYWFSIGHGDSSLREYNLIGVLMGLAMYNSNILDLHFPSVCYRKLLTPPVVPRVDHDGHIGVIQTPSTDDLAEIMPDVSRGLVHLLHYEGNVEDDFCMTFQISIEEYGEIKIFNLIEDGENIAVTNENRTDYVNRYLDWVLNKAVYDQFKSFYLGFHSVCASNALIMLRGEEIEMLVCGSESLNIHELQKVTEYDGFHPDEDFIIDFWDIINTLPEELKKKFLLFVTGSDRVPVGGVSEMTFKVTRLPIKVENLPEAHTCFNQLVLPRYDSKEILKEKLIAAISNAEGFGLE